MTAPTKPLREATTPRRGLSRLEAAVYVGFGLNRFSEMVRAGLMPPPRVHESVQVWDKRELDIYFDALPHDTVSGKRGNYFDDV